jgi:hypothetical protein
MLSAKLLTEQAAFTVALYHSDPKVRRELLSLAYAVRHTGQGPNGRGAVSLWSSYASALRARVGRRVPGCVSPRVEQR